MTTKRDAGERRLLVNLSVIAGSAAMLAASWLSVVTTDRGQAADAAALAAVPAPAGVAVASPPMASANASDAAGLVPTPAPRRVIVTRPSRAS